MKECLPIQLPHKVYYYIMTLLLVIYSLAANAPTSLAVSIVNSTSINVSWIAPVGGANGYIVVYNNDNTQQVSSTHTILSELSPTVHNITVHGYKDVPSVGSNTVFILFNGMSSSVHYYYNIIISFSSSTSQ